MPHSSRKQYCCARDSILPIPVHRIFPIPRICKLSLYSFISLSTCSNLPVMFTDLTLKVPMLVLDLAEASGAAENPTSENRGQICKINLPSVQHRFPGVSSSTTVTVCVIWVWFRIRNWPYQSMYMEVPLLHASDLHDMSSQPPLYAEGLIMTTLYVQGLLSPTLTTAFYLKCWGPSDRHI